MTYHREESMMSVHTSGEYGDKKHLNQFRKGDSRFTEEEEEEEYKSLNFRARHSMKI